MALLCKHGIKIHQDQDIQTLTYTFVVVLLPLVVSVVQEVSLDLSLLYQNRTYFYQIVNVRNKYTAPTAVKVLWQNLFYFFFQITWKLKKKKKKPKPFPIFLWATSKKKNKNRSLFRMKVQLKWQPSGAKMDCWTVSDLVLHESKEVAVYLCLCVDNTEHFFWEERWKRNNTVFNWGGER